MSAGPFDPLGAEAAEAPPLEGVGFWKRALARAIDLLVHLATSMTTGLFVGILLAIGAALQGSTPAAAVERLSTTPFLAYVASLLGSTAMHVLGEGLHGSTIGKRLCGIVVIAEDGGRATLIGALKRSIAYFVDSLFFGLVAAGKMSESPRRQRIGDRWGHTMVVRMAALDPSRRPSGLRFVGAAVAGIAADGLIVFLEVASRLAL